MIDKKSADPEIRGSLEAWLGAAYENLVESGIDSVRILPLSQRLNLARTSFYWFFPSRDALLKALLERWREKNTRSLVAKAEAYSESITEAILNVFDCWLDQSVFDSRFEFAVRTWAQQSTDVATEVAEADATRLAALKRMFTRFGYKELPADVRARTIYLVQIGYISMHTSESVSTRMSRIPSYCEIYTGASPTPRELDRFFARHNYAEGSARPSRASRARV